MMLTVSLRREFVPKFNGNDKLPPADQIKIVHSAPTMEIKEAVMPKQFDLQQDGKTSFHVEIDRKKLIRAFKTEIINCKYNYEEDDQIVCKIKDAETLFRAPPEFDPLIDELYNYFQELLNTKVDEKN